MKKIYNESASKKLAAYSAMAATMVATQADAQTIVYEDIDDVTIEIGDIVLVDVNGDGYDDFLFQATSSTGGVWSFGRVFGNVPSYSVGAVSNKVMGYSGAILPYGSALDAGALVSASADFLGDSSSNPGNVAFLNSIYSGATYGQFADVTDKYLGFSFDVDGNTHYGWMRLDGTVGPVTLTIKDLAYNSTAGESIETGDMGDVVRLSLIDASQLTAYSFGNTIHINVNGLEANNAQVQVSNALGQVVYNNNLDMSGMDIVLNNAATGVYSIRIVADGAVFSKEVFIGQ